MLKSKMLEVFKKIEEAVEYGEEVKVYANAELKEITITINESSPDGGLVDYLYNESEEEVEEDWGWFKIGDITISWMTLFEEEF